MSRPLDPQAKNLFQNKMPTTVSTQYEYYLPIYIARMLVEQFPFTDSNSNMPYDLIYKSK